jgi:hypothetical protein
VVVGPASIAAAFLVVEAAATATDLMVVALRAAASEDESSSLLLSSLLESAMDLDVEDESSDCDWAEADPITETDFFAATLPARPVNKEAEEETFLAAWSLLLLTLDLEICEELEEDEPILKLILPPCRLPASMLLHLMKKAFCIILLIKKVM